MTTRNGTVIHFHGAIIEACGVTSAILPVISELHTHLCLSLLLEYCYFGQFNKQNCSIGTLKELQCIASQLKMAKLQSELQESSSK